MVKVNFRQSPTKVLFSNISIGRYYVCEDRLYLKVSPNRAFDFGQDMFVTVDEKATVILKRVKDIEITVK